MTNQTELTNSKAADIADNTADAITFADKLREELANSSKFQHLSDGNIELLAKTAVLYDVASSWIFPGKLAIEKFSDGSTYTQYASENYGTVQLVVNPSGQTYLSYQDQDNPETFIRDFLSPTTGFTEFGDAIYAEMETLVNPLITNGLHEMRLISVAVNAHDLPEGMDELLAYAGQSFIPPVPERKPYSIGEKPQTTDLEGVTTYWYKRIEAAPNAMAKATEYVNGLTVYTGSVIATAFLEPIPIPGTGLAGGYLTGEKLQEIVGWTPSEKTIVTDEYGKVTIRELDFHGVERSVVEFDKIDDTTGTKFLTTTTNNDTGFVSQIARNDLGELLWHQAKIDNQWIEFKPDGSVRAFDGVQEHIGDFSTPEIVAVHESLQSHIDAYIVPRLPPGVTKEGVTPIFTEIEDSGSYIFSSAESGPLGIFINGKTLGDVSHVFTPKGDTYEKETLGTDLLDPNFILDDLAYYLQYGPTDIRQGALPS